MNRIRTIDGWRGIAILLVIEDHLARHSRLNHQGWAILGFEGVDVFFVISGYIITVRLLEEFDKSSTISLARFYIRRAFRILPLVVVYLTTLCVLSRFVNVDLSPAQVAGSLFFFRNYQLASNLAGISTGHFWSLSIEEHFYLLWPLLLLYARPRRALWLSLIGALTCGLWRLFDCTHPDNPIGRFLPGWDPGLRVFRTDARVDGLLIGCALAILLARPSVRDFILKNFPKETPLLCAALILLKLEYANGYPVTITNYVLIAVSVASTLVVKEGLVYKWLNSRLLVGIGTISFSLYVWQQLFLMQTTEARPLGWLSMFPYNLVCAFVVATCSFYFLERPTARLGRRLTNLEFASSGKEEPSKEILPA
jgi:peptidoglycan/LPS O-acetylase OafA/YrhL